LIEQGAVFEGFSRRVDTIDAATDQAPSPQPRLSPPTLVESA